MWPSAREIDGQLFGTMGERGWRRRESKPEEILLCDAQ